MFSIISNSSYLRILKNSFIAVVLVYGSLHVFFEMIYTIVPIGMIIVGLFSLLLYLVRIPPPDKMTIDLVMGKKTKVVSDTETSDAFKTIAYHGAGLDAPENSIEAFEMCLNKGCYAIHCDVVLTCDDVAIAFCDNTLERITDLNLVINETPWERLKDIDISVKHPFKNKFKTVRIPTLDQVVDLVLTFKEMHLFMELKDNNRKFIQTILDLFEKHPELYSRTVVTAFHPNLIYFIRRSDPKIVCGLGWRPKYFSNYSYNLQTEIGEKRATNIFKHFFLVFCDNIHEWFLPRFTYIILGISCVFLRKDLISIKVVEDWRGKGVRVIAWNVNQPVEKQYFTRTVKVTYMTDTLTGESSVHSTTV